MRKEEKQGGRSTDEQGYEQGYRRLSCTHGGKLSAFPVQIEPGRREGRDTGVRRRNSLQECKGRPAESLQRKCLLSPGHPK